MANVNCSIIGQAYGSKGTSIDYSDTASAYAGFNYTDWYPYALKFTTPAFVGKSASLLFSFKISKFLRNEASSDAVSLRYALCKSDANYSNYDNTTAAVSEPNQIVTGRISFTKDGQVLSVNVDVLEGNTAYYLILWGDNTGGYQQDYCTISAATNHAIILNYNNGLVYIDNGATIDAYQVYIDNGTSWDLCIPYIDNGTGWDQCG